MKQPALFLDRHQALVKGGRRTTDTAQMQLADGVGESLRTLSEQGYRLFVLSNQTGVSLGDYQDADVITASLHLRALFARHKVRIEGIYYCPHAPSSELNSTASDCTCRLPAPGLLLQAANEHAINLAASWVVGSENLVTAGKRVGLSSILLLDPDVQDTEDSLADAVVANCREAAEYIQSHTSSYEVSASGKDASGKYLANKVTTLAATS